MAFLNAFRLAVLLWRFFQLSCEQSRTRLLRDAYERWSWKVGIMHDTPEELGR